MSTALMPVSSTPGRPSVIILEGCSHYVSVHDEWHRSEIKRLKGRMRDLHPDRRWFTKRTLANGAAAGAEARYPLRQPDSINPFLNAKRQLDYFVEQEIIFYRRLGLTLPDSEEANQYVPPPTQQAPLSGRRGSGALGLKGKWNQQRSL